MGAAIVCVPENSIPSLTFRTDTCSIKYVLTVVGSCRQMLADRVTKIAVVDRQVCHGATLKLYLLSYHRIQLQEPGSKAPVIHPGDEEPYLIWGWMGNAKDGKERRPRQGE